MSSVIVSVWKKRGQFLKSLGIGKIVTFMYLKRIKNGEEPLDLRAFRGMLRELERNVNLDIAMLKL